MKSLQLVRYGTLDEVCDFGEAPIPESATNAATRSLLVACSWLEVVMVPPHTASFSRPPISGESAA